MGKARIFKTQLLMICLSQLAGLGVASANSTGPCFDYTTLAVSVDENTNTAYLYLDNSYVDITCGDVNRSQDTVVLRENLDTGEIMEIPIQCGSSSGEGQMDYVDECVPEGSYRYGIAPHTVCGAFPEVTVNSIGECTRTNPDDIPTVYDGDYDWNTTDGDTGGCSVASSPATVVFPVYLIAALVAVGLIVRRRKLQQ